MKLITEKAIEKLEEEFDCLITGDRFDLELEFLYLTDQQFKDGEVKLKEAGIKITRGFTKRTFKVKQSDLVGKVDMSEERVWLSNKNLRATLTSEMDHQRLSNCVGLLEIYLKTEKITKEQGDDYLLRLNESIIPELNERYKGELLPYKPFFPWEKEMIKEAKIKL